MKNCLWIMVLVVFVTTGCAGSLSFVTTGSPSTMVGQQEYRDDMGIDYMYDYLSPYGNWVNLEPYGYVWTPRNTGYQWRPYSDGHWISTQEGWTWMANEEWGSIPFHYGRWGYDDDFGWFWVPGTVWSPAWVSWRWSDQYAGWAPLPPEVDFRDGMDFASLSFNIPSRFWIFMQAPHFLDRDVYRYILPFERNVTIINITSVHNKFYYRNNRIYNDGFGIDAVRRVIRREVPRYTIRDIGQHRRARVEGNDVQVFRPNFKIHATTKPKAVLNWDEARRDLAQARIFEPRQKVSVNAQNLSIRRRQAEEKAMLKQTQSQELKELKRNYNTKMSQMPDTANKTKLRYEHQTQKADIQKQYKAEKEALNQRHKQDSEQVKRVVRRVK